MSLFAHNSVGGISKEATTKPLTVYIHKHKEKTFVLKCYIINKDF